MKARNIILCLLPGLTPLLGIGQAAAQEAPFTIQVPVELRDMHPDIQGGTVYCYIHDAQSTPVAGGGVQFSLDRNTRSFNQTLPVRTQLADGRSPADARTYECVLSLADFSDGTTSRPAAQGSARNVKFEAAPGTPFTPIVTGSIPSATLPAVQPRTPIRDGVPLR